MDFSRYPNINAAAETLGGIKKTVFNKKALAEAEANWDRLSAEDILHIEQQIPHATKILSSYVMPYAICIYQAHTFTVIPVRDILWFYVRVVKQSVNFIPTTKEHYIEMLARDGKTYTLGQVSTGGFSKKEPGAEALETIRQILLPYRGGIVYGYSDEINGFFRQNFAQAVQMVDQKSVEQAQLQRQAQLQTQQQPQLQQPQMQQMQYQQPPYQQ